MEFNTVIDVFEHDIIREIIREKGGFDDSDLIELCSFQPKDDNIRIKYNVGEYGFSSSMSKAEYHTAHRIKVIDNIIKDK
jgi:hypothetical protein